MKKLTSEKSLALKITAVSVVGMIFLMGLIIGSSYIYQENMNIRAFLAETNRTNIANILNDSERQKLPEAPFIRQKGKGERGPRDILVLDENGTIITDSFGGIDTKDIERFQKSIGEKDGTIEILGRTFFVTQRSISTYTVFFFFDLTPLRQFHIDLLLIAFLGGCLSFIGIYLMAEYLARITIEPIKKHNESLGAYSHNVAHELKTPLSIMKSDLEITRIKHPNIALDSVEEEIDTMQRIVDGLLLLAHPEKETSEEKIAIEELIESVLKKYSDDDIKFQADNYKSPEVPKVLFERLFINLLENAKKHGKGNIHIILSQNNLTIENAVEKTISKSELQKLTETFYQGDTSRHTGGHGLGLALVSKIAELLGYSLTLSSEKNIFRAQIRLK